VKLEVIKKKAVGKFLPIAVIQHLSNEKEEPYILLWGGFAKNK